MIAVAYCRVSTDRQARTNDSLPLQDKECRAYCERNGYDLIKVFSEAESATSIDKRPKLNDLIKFCEDMAGEVKTVVVYALNRLSREEMDRLTLRTLLRKMGITLRSVTEPMIDDSDVGEFNEIILGGMAQLENRNRMRRTVAGMKHSTERGNWNHQAPLGYQNTRLNGKKVIVPDTRVANVATGQTAFDLVREAFQIFATGSYGKETVRRHVVCLGLTSKRGNQLAPQSFDKMLRNPFYVGIVREKNGSKPKRYKEDHWEIETTGNHLPLIDQRTWDAVQALLQQRSATNIAPRQKANPVFPLAKFIRCGSCGRPLRGYKAKSRYERYDCQNRTCIHKVKGKAQEMHFGFVGFLERYKPSAEFTTLYQKLILDVLKR
ncbi:MAG: recombinase family protein, partial [Acidobacteriota bacterium]|nr:recombinase family protein [Acidobacteriota bacterium]